MTRGRNTSPSFRPTDTYYKPDDIAPGYGGDEDFGDIPPELLPQPDTGDDVLIPNVETRETGKMITSDPVAVENYNNYPVVVTAVGNDAKLSLAGGSFVNGEDPGISVNEGETFEIQMLSSDEMDQTASTQVTVGDNPPITWTITTANTTWAFNDGWDPYKYVNKNAWTGPPGVQIFGLVGEEKVVIEPIGGATEWKVQIGDEINDDNYVTNAPTEMTMKDGQFLKAKVKSSSNGSTITGLSFQVGPYDPVRFRVWTEGVSS